MLKRLHSYQNKLLKYGTSAGAEAGWDTRGRGKKGDESKSEKPKGDGGMQDNDTGKGEPIKDKEALQAESGDMPEKGSTGEKKVADMSPEEILQVVVDEAQGGFADYAKTYAQAGLDLGGSTEAKVIEHGSGVIEIQHEKTGKPMVGDEMRVQMLYVLSNLSGWKGPRAREVKEAIKQYTKKQRG